MPSVKNPNGPSANKLAARAAKARQRAQKQAIAARSTKTRVERADTTRGAREGLLPTSGPNRAISAKRRRKIMRKLGYAKQRQAAEVEGEVVMRDQANAAAAEATAAQEQTQNNTAATTTTTTETTTETAATNNEVEMMDSSN
ncbi:hypothetical protein F5X96DRAFT_622422 [Biscogniauxia mediterranea]|nr:hypothetical protein F5X96DRAFT_622422 [Biscogniauxia mediterranea]